MDNLTPRERSKIMSRVKSKDSRPELIVRKVVHAMGYRYRLVAVSMLGKLDLVFASRRKSIFVHGCFWPRHTGCPNTRMPKSRVAFWRAKFADNVRRELPVRRRLRRAGWQVLIVWECEVQKSEKLRTKLERFLAKA